MADARRVPLRASYRIVAISKEDPLVTQYPTPMRHNAEKRHPWWRAAACGGVVLVGLAGAAAQALYAVPDTRAHAAPSSVSGPNNGSSSLSNSGLGPRGDSLLDVWNCIDSGGDSRNCWHTWHHRLRHHASKPKPAPTAPTSTDTTGQAQPSATPPAAQGSQPEPGGTTPTTPTTPTTGANIPSSGTTSNGCQITPQQAAAEQSLLTLLNQHRAAAGARPLSLNRTLSLASRQHSCDMFQHHNLDHTGSDGSSPFQRMGAVGVTYNHAGENIGMTDGYALTDGVNLTDKDMMAEPLTDGNHHWNIVNPAYTQVGLGIIYANGQVWLTEDFVG
jgi:uncharacterized protein YkwD